MVCNIPGAFSEISFVSTLLCGNTFYSGLLNGAFTGLRFIGTILFVCGVAVFYYKMKKVKKEADIIISLNAKNANKDGKN